MAICSFFVANPKICSLHPSHELEEAVIFTLPIAQIQCFCHDCFFFYFQPSIEEIPSEGDSKTETELTVNQ